MCRVLRKQKVRLILPFLPAEGEVLFFFFFYWLFQTICGVFIPQLRTEPVPPAVEAQSPHC